MSWSQTLDTLVKIKPELVAQELGNIEQITDGMEMQNVFKTVRNIDDEALDKRTIARDILSIPYVHSASKGPAKSSPEYSDVRITVPPMKFYTRIFAKDLKKAGRYKQQDFMAWLRENYLEEMKKDIDYSLEYLKRSCLTTGDLSYPYFLDSGWNTVALDLGTQINGGSVSPLWNAASTTAEQIHAGIRAIVKTCRATDGSYSYFQRGADLKIYCTEEAWGSAFTALNGRQTIDVVSTRILAEDEIQIGEFTLKSFGASWKNPQTQVSADAVSAHEIRIVDVGPNARHTLAFLELDNVNAVGNNKHYLVQVIPDTYGEYIDICLQVRPVPLFNANASAKATVLS
jgi:hypothetical protein